MIENILSMTYFEIIISAKGRTENSIELLKPHPPIRKRKILSLQYNIRRDFSVVIEALHRIVPGLLEEGAHRWQRIHRQTDVIDENQVADGPRKALVMEEQVMQGVPRIRRLNLIHHRNTN